LSCSNSQGPLYSVIDHLSYLGADWTVCWTEDLITFVLQFLVPLQAFIPQRLLDKLLTLSPDLSPLISAILQPLYPLLGK
jgi:hypothetical protein